MIGLGLNLLLNAAPSIYKLFNSDDKSTAVKELTSSVVKSAAGSLGIELNDKKELIDHLENNPEVVVQLKELEYKYSLDIQKLELEDKKLDYEQEVKQEENRTNRWQSDNSTDSRFAKLIRPGLTAYLVFVVTLLAVFDGNVGSFTIKEVWVTLFTSLCITSVSGYFVLRTYEKRTNTSVWKR